MLSPDRNVPLEGEILSAVIPHDAHVIGGDPLFTPAEVALWLRTSSDELRKMRASGNGPHFVEVARGTYRYRLSDLKAWLSTRRFRTLEKPQPERGRVCRTA